MWFPGIQAQVLLDQETLSEQEYVDAIKSITAYVRFFAT